MYILITIIKLLVLTAGLAFAAVYFFPGIKGDKIKLKKAGLIFSCICLIFILLTVIEFVIAFSKR